MSTSIRQAETVDAALREHFDSTVRMLGQARAFAREREARRLVVAALPRGFGWLVEHPRLVRAYFKLRPSKRPVLRERPTGSG